MGGQKNDEKRVKWVPIVVIRGQTEKCMSYDPKHEISGSKMSAFTIVACNFSYGCSVYQETRVIYKKEANIVEATVCYVV